MNLTIGRLGHQGDGIADGPVFVPRALPGEVIDATVEDGKVTQFRILEPSDQRVKPGCSHYNACGGCALQHASDAFVSDWKVSVVQSAMNAQKIDAPIRGCITSPAQSRRRATLSGRRTKKGVLVGFHMRASDTVVSVPGCILLHPALLSAVAGLEALTLACGSRKGEISFAITASEAGVDVAATGGKSLDRAMFVTISDIARAHDLARVSWDDELVVERNAPRQTFGPASVTPPPGAFLQATAHGQAALVDAVKEAVGDARQVVDLFSGCGTFTLPLAEQAEVRAVENDDTMLDALNMGWRQTQGLKRVVTETRDLFRRPLMPDELNKFDAAVIDPPRAGAEAQTAEICASDLAVVAAVSCNPVTFARDARKMSDAGFDLDWVQVVDQFRWSPHVEIAARFSRKS